MSTRDLIEESEFVENVDAPLWIYDILSNDDDVYLEICGQDHSEYPEYEYDEDRA